jgi:Tfp pilus assembly protein PilF
MTADGLERALAKFADGVHAPGDPSAALDADLPPGIIAVYRAMDGGELFHGDLVLEPRATWRREGGRIELGALGDDLIAVDLASGAVLRLEADSGEWIEEGSALDRWLWGWVEGQGLLYDRDGEFKDRVIGDDGELRREVAIARERALLKRDPRAIGPRWRLARELARAGENEAARDQLEEVVAARPRFAWAWYDLARISEQLGELAGARDEAIAAAEADPAYEHAGFFLAWAARLAALAGDEPARAALAARALATDPDLARRQLDGARDNLEAGDRDAAREMLEVARALAPTDLAVLDLARRLAAT